MSKSWISRVPELRQLYAQGKNIMETLRAWEGSSENSADAVLISYDLQAGSYINYLNDPAFADYKQRYVTKLANVLGPLGVTSLLEAGVGEATTLVPLAKQLPEVKTLAGFDISWSRAAHGARFARQHGVSHLSFSTGDLFRPSFQESSFHTVFTSHAIEPNLGREREALEQLYRIAGRYLVLLEPSWEFGDDATRANMEKHRYARDLRGKAKELGYFVKEHRLFDEKPASFTELLVIEKTGDSFVEREQRLACPISLQPLEFVSGSYVCANCGLVFPCIGGIPCLLQQNGVLATHFLDFV